MTATLTPVPTALLEALAASLPAAPTPERPASSPNGGAFDLERWIIEYLPNASGPTDWQGGRRWVPKVCPWNPDHRNRSAYVVQFANVAIAAGCHHNGCAGQNWQTLRALLEPGRQPGDGSSLHTVAPVRDEVTDPPMPDTERDTDGDPRLEIDAAELDLPKVTNQAWSALRAANDPPYLFRQGGVITRIETGDEVPLDLE